MPIKGILLKVNWRLIRTVIFISYYRPVMCHENVLIDSKCTYVCSPLENVFRGLKGNKVASQNLYKCTTSNFIQVTSVLSALLRRLSFSRPCSCKKDVTSYRRRMETFSTLVSGRTDDMKGWYVIFELIFETCQKLVIKEGCVHFSAPNNSSLYFVTYTWYFSKMRRLNLKLDSFVGTEVKMMTVAIR
jgi:hypothetical protein